VSFGLDFLPDGRCDECGEPQPVVVFVFPNVNLCAGCLSEAHAFAVENTLKKDTRQCQQ